MMHNVKHIPKLFDINGWKNIEIHETGEKLLSIKRFNHNRIILNPQYYINGIKGSINDCLLRESLVEMLIEATKLLPSSWRFVIFDGWRSANVQSILFDSFYNKLRCKYPELNKSQLTVKAEKYVMMPSVNKCNPSPHLTGGSVDLSLLDGNGNLVDMGTSFDSFTDSASTRYFEEKYESGKQLTSVERVQLENRRLLYMILHCTGFTNYCEEWWHYDYGNQFWAKLTKNCAKYGVVDR